MAPPLECIVCGNMVADIIGRPIDALVPRHGVGHRDVDQIQFFTGGFACNVGIDLAKLGVRTGIIGRVGNDGWRDMMVNILQQYSIDLTGLIVDSTAQTPATIVCVDSTGERSFYHTVGAQQNFTSDDVVSRTEYIGQAKLFAFGYYGLVPSIDEALPHVFKTLKSKCNVKILLDSCTSVGPTLPLLSRSLPFVDIFVPSYIEARSLTGRTDPAEMVKVFREHGAAGIVGVKLGGDGCIVDDGNKQIRVPAIPVEKVVDTTGAGDSFLAGMITAFLRGMELEPMARFANAVGGCCVQSLGASTGIRSFEETMKLLQ